MKTNDDNGTMPMVRQSSNAISQTAVYNQIGTNDGKNAVDKKTRLVKYLSGSFKLTSSSSALNLMLKTHAILLIGLASSGKVRTWGFRYNTVGWGPVSYALT